VKGAEFRGAEERAGEGGVGRAFLVRGGALASQELGGDRAFTGVG